MFNWKIVNENYLSYLRDGIEPRIPNVNYGIDKFKPFFGNLFEHENFVYITQISHPQHRHKTMKNSADFQKVYNSDDGRLLCVVNLNYMFPISKMDLSNLKYGDIDKYRSFLNDDEKSKYIDLLRLEMNELNNINLSEKAWKLYNMRNSYPDNPVSRRCFDFKLLEETCMKYTHI